MTSSDNDVFEKAETQDLRTLHDLVRAPPIFITWGDIARRVVVGDSKGDAIISQYRIEDLANWELGAIRLALAYGQNSTDLISVIKDDHEDPLSTGGPEFSHSNSRHILRPANDLSRHTSSDEAPYLASSDQRSRLSFAQSREGGEFLGVSRSD